MFGFGSSKKDKERRAARKTKNDTAAASRLKKNAASKAAQMKAGAAQRKKIADRTAAIKKRKADATTATKPKKAPVKESTANYKAQDKKPVGKGVSIRKSTDAAAKMDNRQSVASSIQKQKTGVAKSATKVTPKPKPGKRGNDSPRAFGTGSSNTIKRDGKALANVTAEQLKASGMSLRGYMNAWKKTGNRPKKK